MTTDPVLKLREGAGCTIDVLSLTRNTASAIPAVASIPAATAAIAGSALAGGFLGVPIGFSLIRGSVKDLKSSIECKNIEGVVQSTLFAGSAVSYTGISAALMANAIFTLQKIAAPAALGTAFLGFGFGVYAPLLLFAGYNLTKSVQFSSTLKEKDPFDALCYLGEQIGVHEKDPIKQKKKIEQFALRTSPACAEMVSKEIGALLKNYNRNDALSLIEKVKEANFKNKIKQALFLLVSILGIITMFFIAFSTGPVAPILFAVGALLWLTVDSSHLHKFIGDKCWNLVKEKKVESFEEKPLLVGDL